MYKINIASLRKGGTLANPNFPSIRADRANPILGNPFILHNHLDNEERAYVIAEYEKWADKQMATNPIYQNEIKRAAAILKKAGTISLICWCSPRPCHASKIKELILKELENEKVT